MSDTGKTVIECIKQVSGRDDITEDMIFGKDIAMTSVSAMKLAFDLENAMDVDNIPIEKLYDIKTVSELIEFAESLK